MHRFTIGRCLAATVAIVGLTGGVSAWADPPALVTDNPAAQELRNQGAEPLPSPGDAMAAFGQVETWVRDWEIPEAAVGLPNVTAASVTLRLDGRLIGRGSAVASEPGGSPKPILAATKQALDEARGRVPIERDALFEEALRHMAPSLAISLELGGQLVPFEANEYADVSLKISPGLEGVAVRMGTRMDALLPGTMLANATEPASALGAVVSRLSGEPALGLKPPRELAVEHGAVFYRFGTLHLAQPEAGIPPMFLHRGGRVVDRRELTSAGIRAWASGLADHLVGRTIEGPEFVRAGGTYHPVTGISEPVFAGPAEQSLVALALVQYSELAVVSGSRSLEMRDVAERLLRSLAGADDAERDPVTSPAAVATSWVALRALSIERPDSGSPQMRRDHEQLVEYFDRLNSIMDQWEADITHVPTGQRAIAVWALARRSVEGRTRIPAVNSAVRRLYRETEPGHLVTHMPWLGWAELTLARFQDEPGVAADVPAAVALREMREQMWNHQLSAHELAYESRDMAGGILFTASRNPLPTWHAARPLAFIGTMLGDERLTSDSEVPAELSHLLASLRFLRQLSAGEAEGHMYRSPRTAAWGTRASLWDQRMPTEASALALLMVCEVLNSLDGISERQRAAEGEGGAR